MTTPRVFVKSRILAGLAVLYIAWQAWLSLDAPGKISAGLETGAGKVNVLVTLPFPPERFHVLAFQRYGRVSGTRDLQVEIRGVEPKDLRAVARHFWVKKVEPLGGEQS